MRPENSELRKFAACIELGGVDRFADVHGLLRHLVAAGDHDDEDAAAAERHELDALKQRLRVRRRDREADALAGFRQHVRRRRQQVVHQRRIAGFLPQARFDRRRVLGGAARVEQHVDVAAIARVGRHAARRGMRLPDVAHLLELRQHVADGGGRQVQARLYARASPTRRVRPSRCRSVRASPEFGGFGRIGPDQTCQLIELAVDEFDC